MSGHVVDVLLVGRHGSLMGYLARLLESDRAFCVREVVPSLELARQAIASARPAVVILDVDTMAADWVDRVQAVTSHPDAPIVVLISGSISDALIAEAFEADAAGLLDKYALGKSLLPALHEVLSGGSCFPGDIYGRVEIGPDGPHLLPDLAETLRG